MQRSAPNRCFDYHQHLGARPLISAVRRKPVPKCMHCWNVEGDMKAIVSIFVFIFIVFSASATSVAKEWRGITPLHSTREDVERLLGPPPPPPTDGTMIYKLSKTRSIYFLEEGEVYIVFEE